MKFALTKDFESMRFGIPKSERTFEIIKLSKDEYTLLEHIGYNVSEIYTFTKEEFKTLWMALTIK